MTRHKRLTKLTCSRSEWRLIWKVRECSQHGIMTRLLDHDLQGRQSWLFTDLNQRKSTEARLFRHRKPQRYPRPDGKRLGLGKRERVTAKFRRHQEMRRPLELGHWLCPIIIIYAGLVQPGVNSMAPYGWRYVQDDEVIHVWVAVGWSFPFSCCDTKHAWSCQYTTSLPPVADGSVFWLDFSMTSSNSFMQT